MHYFYVTNIPNLVDNMLGYSPRYSKAVVSRGPPTKLVNQNKAVPGGGVEYCHSLKHLSHECRDPLDQTVGGANSDHNRITN